MLNKLVAVTPDAQEAEEPLIFLQLGQAAQQLEVLEGVFGEAKAGVEQHVGGRVAAVGQAQLVELVAEKAQERQHQVVGVVGEAAHGLGRAAQVHEAVGHPQAGHGGQHVGIEPRIDRQDRAADHAGKTGKAGAECEHDREQPWHRDADDARHLRIVDARADHTLEHLRAARRRPQRGDDLGGARSARVSHAEPRAC